MKLELFEEGTGDFGGISIVDLWYSQVHSAFELILNFYVLGLLALFWMCHCQTKKQKHLSSCLDDKCF